MIHIERVVANDFKQLREIDLRLPRRGRFLVQGRNEAGKSTLFEAVYFALFGRALVTESGHARLDDVIRYGAQEAWVDVEIGLDGGRRMRVVRRVRRDRPNVWELDVIDRLGAVEEVRGNSVVNDRIAAELKLDGDALLNTCFVEQKKLEKLEGMSRAMREQSLMKLLNLDRVVELADDLKVRGQDHAHVARLRDRAELAKLQSEMPTVEAALAEVLDQWSVVDVQEALLALRSDCDALAALRAESSAAAARADGARALAERAETARLGLERLNTASTALDRALEAHARAARLAGDLQTARLAQGEVPRIIARGKTARRLEVRHRRLTHLDAERTTLNESVRLADIELAECAAGRAELNGTRRALIEARDTAREAESQVAILTGDARAFQVRDALSDWASATETTAVVASSREQIDALRRGLEAATRRTRLELGAVGLALLACMLGAYWWRPLALATVPVVLLLAWRWLANGRIVNELSTALGRAQGEADARAHDADARSARLAEAVARLETLNAVRPATPERARRTIGELDARLVSRRRADVDEALTGAQTALAGARAEAMRLETLERQLRKTYGDVDAAALGQLRDERQARVVRIGRALERLVPRVDAQAIDLNIARSDSAISEELGVLRAAALAAREKAAQVPAIERELTAARDAEARHTAQATAAWSQIPPYEGLPEWSPGLAPADRAAVAGALRQAFDDAGGDDARVAAEAASREASEFVGRLNGAASAWRAKSERAAELTASLDATDVALPSAPTVDDINETLSRIEPLITDDKATLEARRNLLTERLSVVRHEMNRLSRSLGLGRAELDAATAIREHDAAARRLEVRRRAAAIVDEAGRNVVQRVMPSTIEHMRRLLPSLTDGRYFDAQLGDDYKIEVFDDRAGSWKQKNIFSGGTRDQLSLALRLAFALATLPAERGTAPSFLFLDEPLGAFDAERAHALILLLTEGEIAESFDQIFLISHVRVEPELFDYRILLEDGRIVESNL